MRTPTIARHGRLKKSNPFATITRFLAAALAVLMVSGASVAAIAAYDLAASVKPGVELVGDDTPVSIPKIGAWEGGLNLLLVGSDSRKGQDPAFGEDDTGDLNDVTMLLHVSADHSSATVVSFPRDMYVPIPSCPDPEDEDNPYPSMSYQKINTTLSYGGLPCTVLTVEELTGLDIRFAAEVQFSGVIAMSNAVGGVPVCVGARIEDEYTGIFLDPGEHTLMGVDALQFLRTRHGVGDGSDLTRIGNQQVFLSSLMRTIKSADTLSDPAKLYSLAKAALSNVVLSTQLQNVDNMVAIAMALKDIPLEQINFVQYPTGSVDGGVEPNVEAADALLAALVADQPIQLGGATGGTLPDPNAPVDPNATIDASAVDADGAVVPDAAADPGATVLPSDILGQSAGQYTCSDGRTLDDQ
ncbi:LCP family protein [Microterricola viridarii]|uniref:Cell envelope-related function transcriptional attenuator common domain-containing protein n=1 Tax=Microterricola viridarii TaxID=412690 RepID=A0A1H1MLP9_9MICO|nr:LCP family protein [Microterricola viridarii]SDR87741.1 cell envelope-related function transcriptional attenuator common domain-containing protein [Microterricola viridarii]